MKNMIDLNQYNIYTLRDCYDDDKVCGLILLNTKHTINEFQQEINRIKEEFADEISKYGDDWSIIAREVDEKIDWLELSLDENYLVF